MSPAIASMVGLTPIYICCYRYAASPAAELQKVGLHHLISLYCVRHTLEMKAAGFDTARAGWQVILR